MDNQHRKIAGYRELSQEEIDLMNFVKSLGPKIKEVCDKVDAHVTAQYALADSDQEYARLDSAEPDKWLTEARVELQKGLMCLTRAVAQPEFF